MVKVYVLIKTKKVSESEYDLYYFLKVNQGEGENCSLIYCNKN